MFAIYENGDECADAGGIEESDAAHVEDEAGGGFGAHGLNEGVDGFEAEFAVEADDLGVAVGDG